VLRFRLMVKRGHRCTGPKHQKEKRSMDHFAGLDVSVKETSVPAQAVLNPGDVPASFNANFSHSSFNIFRVGLNYHFGCPLCAKSRH
jgi:hypothetical protein